VPDHSGFVSFHFKNPKTSLIVKSASHGRQSPLLMADFAHLSQSDACPSFAKRQSNFAYDNHGAFRWLDL